MDCAEDSYSRGCGYRRSGACCSIRLSFSCQHALYFPDIAGVPLSSRDSVHTTDLCKGKVSVIAMLSTVISEVTWTA